jgi:Zn-dependent metalloprotease
MSARHSAFCSIIPPHVLRHLAEHAKTEEKQAALDTLERSAALRLRREEIGPLAAALRTPSGERRRAIHDMHHKTRPLPGPLVRGEADRDPVADASANAAYDGLGDTYDFYKAVLGRNSLDGRGLRLVASVHYGRHYDNAYWDGQQMIFGDGDGAIFGDFTSCLDVIGHELTHGVVQYTADLAYHDQPGALNESYADVFGSLVKQWKHNQTARKADWLIGVGLLAPGVKGKALRSMAAPGTAYDDPRLGKDPQPARMKDYVKGEFDDGGVHINSGIPNHAFYLVAMKLAGHAWQKAGPIWFDALLRLGAESSFQDAAGATALAAATRFGRGSREEKAVREAWTEVGLAPQAAGPDAPSLPAPRTRKRADRPV